jgi:hypothetical protein
MKKYEWNMQDFWDAIKRPSLGIMRIEEGEEVQDKGMKSIFNKVIGENFPNI